MMDGTIVGGCSSVVFLHVGCSAAAFPPDGIAPLLARRAAAAIAFLQGRRAQARRPRRIIFPEEIFSSGFFGKPMKKYVRSGKMSCIQKWLAGGAIAHNRRVAATCPN
jgi:hypothetical protein